MQQGCQPSEKWQHSNQGWWRLNPTMAATQSTIAPEKLSRGGAAIDECTTKWETTALHLMNLHLDGGMMMRHSTSAPAEWERAVQQSTRAPANEASHGTTINKSAGWLKHLWCGKSRNCRIAKWWCGKQQTAQVLKKKWQLRSQKECAPKLCQCSN